MNKASSTIIFCLSMILSLLAIDKLLQPSRDLMIQRSDKDYEKQESSAVVGTKLNVPHIFYAFPPPTEICFLLKNLKSSYHKKLLTPILSGDQYTSDFKRTLHLGMYHTDMTYFCVFEQKSAVLPYLEAIKRRENKLQKIGTLLFDSDEYFPPLYKIENLDSLITQSSLEMNSLQIHLEKVGRADLDFLICTGIFVESLYLAAKTFETNPKQELKDWIGEQDIILNQILLMLSFYEYGAVKDLINDLDKLRKIYEDEVKLEYTHKKEVQPAIEENEILLQKDNYISEEISITDTTISKITKTITQIRNTILE